MPTLLAKGMTCIYIGMGMLPLSILLAQELWTSIGGKPTGKVVFETRAGTVEPPNLIGQQFDRSAIVRTASLVAIAAGLILVAIALVARRLRGAPLGTDKGTLRIFGKTLRNCFGFLFIGALAGMIIFAPLKALPDIGFYVVFALVCIGLVLLVLLKRIDVSKLLYP